MHSVAPPPRDPLSEPGPWNAAAAGYDEVVFDELPAIYDAAIELLQAERGDRILDVATGPGTLAIRLAPRVGHVVAVDFAEVMLERLRGHIMRSRLSNVEARRMNAEQLAFEDSSFDAVVSVFGVCWFDDRQRGLEEMLRVVVPGGKALAVHWAAPTENTFLGAGEDALRAALPGVLDGRAAARTGDAGACAAELMRVGFEPVSVVPFSHRIELPSVAEYWHRLERRSPKLELLASRIGPDDYRAAAERACAALRAAYGESRFELRASALLACGVRPRSAA